jgi:hypothetical protein
LGDVLDAGQAQAATVIAGAQLLSNGHSARSIAQMLSPTGSASNWASDRLYRQLSPLADKLTEARTAGQPRIAEVRLDVPLKRGLTPDLGHADSSTMLGKRESKDGKEELHGRVPSAGGGLV